MIPATPRPIAVSKLEGAFTGWNLQIDVKIAGRAVAWSLPCKALAVAALQLNRAALEAQGLALGLQQSVRCHVGRFDAPGFGCKG